MKKRSRKLTPLSAHAEKELVRHKDNYGWIRQLRRPDEYRTEWFHIMLANARDHRVAARLTAALEALKTVNVLDYAVIDNFVGDEWQPFRVERGLTGALRGEMTGNHFAGVMTTNMLDSSSVVFLQNDTGETLRVLIPSPATTVEMLANTIRIWTCLAGGRTDRWHHQYGTFKGGVIDKFALTSGFSNALTHPEVIDMIDASCQKPHPDRPKIRVVGRPIQKGVALASALEVNGEQHMFVPTGFFRALTGLMQKFVPDAHEPRLLTT